MARGACGNYGKTALKHWVDEDRDCQNSRHEMLIGASTFKKAQLLQQSGYPQIKLFKMSMRGLGPQLGNDPYVKRIVGELGPQSDLDPMMTVMADWVQSASKVDSVSEEVVGGLGPQLPNDPMRGVDDGFVQALLQQNADPFAEQIVGGLGPQPFNAVTYSEVFADGQLHIIPATDVETFIVPGI